MMIAMHNTIPDFTIIHSLLALSTNQDKKAWYSNFGEWVIIAAPGGETFVNNESKGV